MITEELITFHTAQLAKQAGFKEPVYSCYDKEGYQCMILDEEMNDYNSGGFTFSELSAPSQSLLQRWIREVYNYEVQVHYLPNIEAYCCTYTPKAVKPNTFKSANEFKKHTLQYYSTDKHKTYELALEQALQKALTLIINRKETNNEQG